MSRVHYLLKYSCAATLSIKHGNAIGSYKKVFGKYGKDLTIIKNNKILAKFVTHSRINLKTSVNTTS
jgi:hypothetical protein